MALAEKKDKDETAVDYCQGHYHRVSNNKTHKKVHLTTHHIIKVGCKC